MSSNDTSLAQQRIKQILKMYSRLNTLCLIQGDKISMWLCETKPQEAAIKIGQTLKRRLGIDDKVS